MPRRIASVETQELARRAIRDFGGAVRKAARATGVSREILVACAIGAQQLDGSIDFATPRLQAYERLRSPRLT